jgi:hypothetical protein
MSDIKVRTVFVDDSDGIVRFHDWALVVTDLGEMLEPFSPLARFERNTLAGLSDWDWTEPMCRIDRIQRFSLDRGLQILGDTMTGGTLMPRAGR